ncbi:glycosyltransferase family 2 protein [Pontibacillus sp. HMF3514]|uniref:glycosyltransferase family 2 protein n=1 Tax=Pontibacillus sp. HMF3514 TaxID=2692425 RepID=UPI00131FD1D7|nr:glycosyltransferase family 2 protein [Pontibacillus sp. HMF3514]QHE53729.1 glycosyltransferase [Pontibacillus sp. HMF3514]
MTRISVCIATYNGEKYIKEQLDSILNQLSYCDELIISDDHSDDNTVSIINEYKDSRIKVFYNQSERGYTNNFCNALSKAKGEYIFLSDQDDIWLPEKVEITLKKLQNYDFVVSDAKTANSSFEIISNSRFEEFDIDTGFLRNFIKSRYIGCCMAFNRKVLLSIFPFPQNTEYAPHDTWITLVSEFYFRTSKIEQPLIIYRRHGNNASDGGYSKGRSLQKKLVSRYYCLRALLQQRKNIKKIHSF